MLGYEDILSSNKCNMEVANRERKTNDSKSAAAVTKEKCSVSVVKHDEQQHSSVRLGLRLQVFQRNVS